MFQGCFTYNYKGPCYVYYLKTAEQKELYKDAIKILNAKEVEAKCYKAFAEQEKEKERQQIVARKKFLTKRAS